MTRPAVSYLSSRAILCIVLSGIVTITASLLLKVSPNVEISGKKEVEIIFEDLPKPLPGPEKEQIILPSPLKAHKTIQATSAKSRSDPQQMSKPVEVPPSPASFGLSEEEISESGDLETSIGNTLLTSPDSIVKTNPEMLPPGNISTSEISSNIYRIEQLYLEYVRNEIASHYPIRAKKMHIEGTVRIHLVLEQTGHILEVSLLTSSGYAALDKGVLDCLQRIAYFPPFPTGIDRKTWELEVPVTFKLH